MTAMRIEAGAAPTAALPPDAEVRYVQGDAALTMRRAYCKGCNLCIDACPPGILALDEDERVLATDIGRCLFCGVCAARCPDFVFVIEPAGRSREGG